MYIFNEYKQTNTPHIYHNISCCIDTVRPYQLDFMFLGQFHANI